MRILKLVHGYYPFLGGGENHMRFLSQALVKLGEDVTVFAPNVSYQNYLHRNKEREDNILNETIKGVKVRRFRILYGWYYGLVLLWLS